MHRITTSLRESFAYLWRQGRFFTQYAVNLMTGAIQQRPPLPPLEEEEEEIDRGQEERSDDAPPPGHGGVHEEAERVAQSALEGLDDPNREEVVQHVYFRGLQGDPEGVRRQGTAIYTRGRYQVA